MVSSKLARTQRPVGFCYDIHAGHPVCATSSPAVRIVKRQYGKTREAMGPIARRLAACQPCGRDCDGKLNGLIVDGSQDRAWQRLYYQCTACATRFHTESKRLVASE